MTMNNELAGATTPTPSAGTNNTQEEKQQRLLTAKTSPADILQNTLLGLGEEDDDNGHPTEHNNGKGSYTLMSKPGRNSLLLGLIGVLLVR